MATVWEIKGSPAVWRQQPQQRSSGGLDDGQIGYAREGIMCLHV